MGFTMCIECVFRWNFEIKTEHNMKAIKKEFATKCKMLYRRAKIVLFHRIYSTASFFFFAIDHSLEYPIKIYRLTTKLECKTRKVSRQH